LIKKINHPIFFFKRDPRLNPPPPLEGEDNRRGRRENLTTFFQRDILKYRKEIKTMAKKYFTINILSATGAYSPAFLIVKLIKRKRGD